MFNVSQRKRTLQISNLARSIQSLVQQVSAYIRISVPPSLLPQSINLGSGSKWTTSALAASVIETATLPTRQQAIAGPRTTLPVLEAMLNTTGRRTIFELRASISPPVGKRSLNGVFHRGNVTTTSGNTSTPNATNRDPPPVASSFDFSFTAQSARQHLLSSEHIFGLVELKRRSETGPTADTEAIDSAVGEETVAHRSVWHRRASRHDCD